MSDIKLFRIDIDNARELQAEPMSLEKDLQCMIEQHMGILLGMRFLATEYSTGKKHGGRIDTLGLDENNCPVIIEYKRTSNDNVITQGLYYLDWLMDHKAEFVGLVRERLGDNATQEIEWSSPRLLCIAADFNKYDEHAVEQIDRNIELVRYRHYGQNLLLLELVNAVFSVSVGGTTGVPDDKDETRKVAYKTAGEYLQDADPSLQEMFNELSDYCLSLGDDVQMKELKYYFAFKRIRNFCCAEIRPQSREMLLYLKLDPDHFDLDHADLANVRDVRDIGHYGTGDFEIRLKNMAEFDQYKHFIQLSYDLT